jgi:hypothetical protein
MSVNVHPPVGNAGKISGPSVIKKEATGISYSVPAISGATSYLWTVPSGVTIISGQNTRTITVDFNSQFEEGTVKVRGRNSCTEGNASNLSVKVLPPPFTAGKIKGPKKVLRGEKNVIFTVDSIPNATTYNWQLPSGATVVSGNNSNTIVVNFNEFYTSGEIAVYGENISGTGPVSPALPVSVQEAEYLIYPNPNNGAFTVSIASEYEKNYIIRIFNSMGRKIYEARDIKLVDGVFEFPVDLRPVPSGIYLIQFISDKDVESQKIIIGNQ